MDTDKKSSAWALEEVAGVAAMALLVLITLVNVLVRYFTSQSFAWTEEISVFLLVLMTLAGAAIAAGQDGHIRIEFFYSRGSRGRRMALAALSVGGTALLFGLLAVLIARAGLSEYEFGETTTGLGLPRWWYTASLPLFTALVALRAVTRGWRTARAGTEGPPHEPGTIPSPARQADAGGRGEEGQS
ncbi:TRAP transporter small permease [Hydrogenophaga electricum]|uniref:TRAP transporter small permease protein n=1 Tax=Hydrogenophaga electricum TaxID=1230953 RepID=A0ABQ6BZH1_9BURK|nr:TRAP transporter small permease [Hydrogenophaga electricum]GLS13117.1 hypothetical protein GCM10007935_05460 [Hydrogenophaga electricum]